MTRALRPAPLVIASMLALSACAKPPEGKPIVLRRPSPAPRVVKRAGPPKTATEAATQDETLPLSPSEKEDLFRAFNTYLDHAIPQK